MFPTTGCIVLTPGESTVRLAPGSRVCISWARLMVFAVFMSPWRPNSPQVPAATQRHAPCAVHRGLAYPADPPKGMRNVSFHGVEFVTYPTWVQISTTEEAATPGAFHATAVRTAISGYGHIRGYSRHSRGKSGSCDWLKKNTENTENWYIRLEVHKTASHDLNAHGCGQKSSRVEFR